MSQLFIPKANLISTVSLYVDGSRTDSYTATGTIEYPYKTLSAAVTGMAATGASKYALHVAPGSYTEASNLVFGDYDLTIYFNMSTLIVNSGAGKLSVQGNSSIYDLVLMIGAFEDATADNTVFVSVYGTNILGAISVTGTTIFTDCAVLLANTTISANGVFIGANTAISTGRITNSGSAFLIDMQISANDNANYVVTSTANGSNCKLSNVSVINAGTGGGVNVSNNAVAANPNAVTGGFIKVNGTTNALTCGSAATIYDAVRCISSSTGNPIPPTGTAIQQSFSGETSMLGTMTSPVNKITNPPQALVIDQATTNLITNPSIESATTGYTAAGSNCTISRVTTQAFSGAASMEAVVTPATANAGWISTTFAVSPSTTYVFSCYVRATAANVALYGTMTGDNSGATNGGGGTFNASWTRYSMSKTTNGSDTTVTVQLRTNGAQVATFYTDAIQLEAKTSATPTSYCDGSLGVGYQWSGTAHASTSSRVAGMSNNAIIAAGSSYHFSVRPDGSLSGTQMFFNPDVLQGINTFDLDFQAYRVTQASIGVQAGLMRVHNTGNGVALWVKSAVTTDIGMVIEASAVTSGSLLALAVPSDKTNFTGEYFNFIDKSGLSDHKWSKNRQLMGSANQTIRKYLQMIGGGRITTTNTSKTGTISSSGTAVTGSSTTFLTDFIVGDVIVSASGQERSVATITDDTHLTTSAAFSPTLSGSNYSKGDLQYEPPMIIMESMGADHRVLDTADFYNTIWFASTDRPRYIRSTSKNSTTGAFPTADTDGFAFDTVQFRDSTSRGPSATGTETSIITGYTLPADRLGTDGIMRIKCYGTNSGAGATKQLIFRVKLGATTVLTTHAETIASTATNNWVMEIIVGNTATNAQKNSLIFQCMAATDGAAVEHIVDYETSAVDTTADLAVVVTADFDTAVGTLTCEYVTIEIF